MSELSIVDQSCLPSATFVLSRYACDSDHDRRATVT